MKKLLLASAITMAACGAVQAQDAGVYIGAKGGIFLIDLEEASDPSGAGFLLGYNFGKGPAIEFEHTKSGGIDVGYGLYSYGTMELETNALYVAYRSEGTAFFKVKAGILQEDVKVKNYSFADESETGLSLGAGVGFNMGDIAQLEAEYTIIEQDASLVSLGLNLRF